MIKVISQKQTRSSLIWNIPWQLNGVFVFSWNIYREKYGSPQSEKMIYVNKLKNPSYYLSLELRFNSDCFAKQFMYKGKH